jgi:hypothetical protein
MSLDVYAKESSKNNLGGTVRRPATAKREVIFGPPLSVTNTETGEVQWQLDLEIPATRVFWSPDSRWLLLDSHV